MTAFWKIRPPQPPPQTSRDVQTSADLPSLPSSRIETQRVEDFRLYSSLDQYYKNFFAATRNADFILKHIWIYKSTPIL